MKSTVINSLSTNAASTARLICRMSENLYVHHCNVIFRGDVVLNHDGTASFQNIMYDVAS